MPETERTRDEFMVLRQIDDGLERTNLGALFVAYEMALYRAATGEDGKWPEASFLRANLVEAIKKATSDG